MCRLGHSAAGKHLPLSDGCLHQPPQDPVLSACLHLFCKAICMCWKHMCAVWVWQSCSLQAFAGAFTKTPGDKCLTARRA